MCKKVENPKAEFASNLGALSVQVDRKRLALI